MKIAEEISPTGGSFYLEKDGEKLAEMIFSLNEENLVIIETKARPEYTDHDEGLALVMYAVNYARENYLSILAVCPYANSVFLKNPEIRDVLK